MRGKYFIIVLVLIALLMASLYSIVGLCPLCRRGVTTLSLNKVRYLGEYSRLKMRYEYLLTLYSRLVSSGYDLPFNVSNELDTVSILLENIYKQVNNSEFVGIDGLLTISDVLLNDTNQSLFNYMVGIRPNRWLAKHYFNEYLSLLNKIDIMLEIMSHGYFGGDYKELLLGIKNGVKNLLNGIYYYSVAVHEAKLLDYRGIIDRVWLQLGLDKVFNDVGGLDWGELYGYRVNILNLIKVAGEIINESKDVSLKITYRDSLSKALYLLKEGDEAFFVHGDYYAAKYIYSLVDGYLRYYIDNKDIISHNRSLYKLFVDSSSPILYINDPVSNHTSVLLILDKILLYRDIDGNRVIDPDEVIGEVHLCNALWSVRRFGSETIYTFSNYFINISVLIGGDSYKGFDSLSLGFGEVLFESSSTEFIQVNYSVSREVLGDVGGAVVFKVVTDQPELGLRWDHFLFTDSFNLDKFPNTPVLSVYMKLYGYRGNRYLIYLYNESCCPKTYEIILFPVTINGGYVGSLSIWVKGGVYMNWWDYYFSASISYIPLIILIILFIAAIVLVYRIRYVYLIDIM